MRSLQRHAGVVSAAVLIIFAAAACSSSVSNSSSSSSSPSAGQSSAATAALTTLVNHLLANPSNIGIDTPLTKKPTTGKLLVALQTPTDAGLLDSQVIAQAAQALGWQFKNIVEGTSATAAADAFNQALLLHPNAIHYLGTPAQSIQPELNKAKADGIVVVPGAITDPAAPPLLSNNISSAAFDAGMGRALADYVALKALQSGGTAHVAIFALNFADVFNDYNNAFKSELAKYCPQCTVTEVPQQLTDIGTNTPSSVVNTLRKTPDITWAIFNLGEEETGVEAALKAAGLENQATIGGLSPVASNFQEMKSGVKEVWDAFSYTSAALQVVDQLARHWDGDSLAPALAYSGVFQLVDQNNVSTINFDSKGNYVGYPNALAAYEKLWQVSS